MSERRLPDCLLPPEADCQVLFARWLELKRAAKASGCAVQLREAEDAYEDYLVAQLPPEMKAVHFRLKREAAERAASYLRPGGGT